MAIFLKRKKALIYLDSFGLEISVDVRPPARLNFSPGTIELLEKGNQSSLKTQIANFVKNSDFKDRRAVMVLSKELMFKKYVEEDLSKAVLNFKVKMPYVVEDIACRAFANAEKKFILGTNKKYFLYVRQAFCDLNWKVKYVIPEFDLVLFSPDNRLRLLKKQRLLKKINFMKTL